MKKYLFIVLIITAIIVGIFLYLFISKNIIQKTDNQENTINNELDVKKKIFTLEIITSDNSIVKYKVSFIPNSKLSTILTSLAKEDKNFSFETEESDFGEYIISINGIKADSNKEFWNLKTNGNNSTLGISDFVPQENDLITFTILNF